MTVELLQGDSNVILRRLADQGRKVHTCLTDPPYYLESIVKRFGKQGAAPAQHGADGRFNRQSRGFMGQTWDAADENGYRIAHDPEFWRAVYDILLPGGFCIAFSSPRTGHWQAVAMEQAGFIMHPFIGWAYGSGLAKGHAITKFRPDAEDWDGWFYGTQTLKPAIEPIYIGQKPYSEKTGYANVIKHGVGAFNIAGCQVPSEGDGKGRWPANLVHDGSTAIEECFPEASGQKARLKAASQEGESKTGRVYQQMRRGMETKFPRDSGGSASRFFNCFPHSFGGDVEDSPFKPIFYHAKATKADRAGSAHPTVKPVGLLRHLARLVTPPGGTVIDPFAGSGTTGDAATQESMSAILIEREAAHAHDIRRRFGMPSLNEDVAEQYLQRLFRSAA